jgi:hypothetical protein
MKKKKRIRVEIPEDAAASLYNIVNEDGWQGCLTRDEAPQAKFKNGARITKTVNEKGDITALGMGGTILGSIFYEPAGVGYFIEWDDKPREAIFCIEARIG